MSVATLERAIAAESRILLDTTTLIAYLNRRELISPVAAHVIDHFVREGRNSAIVSMVTVMEVLVRPLAPGPGEAYLHSMDFLTRFPNLRAVPVDLPVAQEAASLRAGYRLETPDALVVATGVVHQVGHLVTNDADWTERLRPIARRIQVCHLTHHLPFP